MTPIKLLASTLLLLLSSTSFAFENLMYTWRGFPDHIAEGHIAIADLKAHGNKIDWLSSQAYHIDEKGLVFGDVNPQMTALARAQHIKILPLVGNAGFDPNRTHIFLTNLPAQQRAVAAILQLCQQNQFAGLQIDFEGIHFTDRDAFTRFYQSVADILHQHHFIVAIALIPQLSNNPPATDYLKGRLVNWDGGYDYQAIGASSDFVTLMGYDQHGGITPPGPMAGIPWLTAIVKYALQYIPADKISIGIPLHSGYWYTGRVDDGSNDDKTGAKNPIRMQQTDLTYAEIMEILKNNQATLRWDNLSQVPYTFFINHFLYEYVFAENAASFRAKLALVKKYHLRGISNWCLGEEDPKIWQSLPVHAALVMDQKK